MINKFLLLCMSLMLVVIYNCEPVLARSRSKVLVILGLCKQKALKSTFLHNACELLLILLVKTALKPRIVC